METGPPTKKAISQEQSRTKGQATVVQGWLGVPLISGSPSISLPPQTGALRLSGDSLVPGWGDLSFALRGVVPTPGAATAPPSTQHSWNSWSQPLGGTSILTSGLERGLPKTLASVKPESR